MRPPSDSFDDHESLPSGQSGTPNEAPRTTPREAFRRASSQRSGGRTAHQRAKSVRAAAHDVHGFETHGHVARHGGVREPVDLDALEEAARRRRERLAERKERGERRRRRRTERGAQLANNPRRRLLRRLAGTAVVLALGFGVFELLTAPEMAVRSVQIEGAHLTSPEALQRVQALVAGKNFFRADLNRAERILQNEAPVKQVQVRRLVTWPPQVVAIVTERQPFARVGSGDNWWVVDEGGVPFRRANDKDGELQAIYNAVWTPQPGEALPADSWKRAQQFVQLLGAEKAEGHDWKLRRVYFDKHGFASIRITGGPHDELLVQLGSDDWGRKLARAREAMAYFDKTGRRAEELNLITYSMPVWTPRLQDESDDNQDEDQRAENPEGDGTRTG